ncbi:MAG: 5-formyltetrahydrofolate cyclo-ligase [Gilvibacter sp.]
MDKAYLRKHYKSKRAQHTPEHLEDLSLAIANQALKLAIWDKQFYHIFLPIHRLCEINTEYLLHILQGKDKSVVLSKSDFEAQTLTHYLLEDNTELIENKWGIVEPKAGIVIAPKQLEVIFVPLLAYDKAGNRIGYGKGFYDRFLTQCDKDVIKVGLSYFEPEAAIKATTQDVPLDFCITPKNIYSF